MNIGNNAAAQLDSFMKRINRLLDEKEALTADIAEIYAEAKSDGYCPKTMRKVVARMRMDAAKLAEQEALIETYLAALGELKDTPLGQAALQRAS